MQGPLHPAWAGLAGVLAGAAVGALAGLGLMASARGGLDGLFAALYPIYGAGAGALVLGVPAAVLLAGRARRLRREAVLFDVKAPG
jgi:hypothetical protein